MKSTICVYYSDRKCHGMPRTEKRNLISSPNIQSFKNIHFEFLLIYEMKIIRDCLKKRRGRQRRDRHDDTKREGDGARESREGGGGPGLVLVLWLKATHSSCVFLQLSSVSVPPECVLSVCCFLVCVLFAFCTFVVRLPGRWEKAVVGAPRCALDDGDDSPPRSVRKTRSMDTEESQPSMPTGTAGSSNPVVVYWMRRDFRMFDNPALLAALSTGATVVRGAFHSWTNARTCSTYTEPCGHEYVLTLVVRILLLC